MFYRNPEFESASPQKTPQEIRLLLTRLEERILSEIRKEPRASRRELALNLKLSEDTVKEYIDRLRKKDILKRVGPDKGGHWEVVEDGKGGE